MPTVDVLQAAFTGGEISGSASGRVDLDFYKTALKYDENWMPRTPGSMWKRPGMRDIAGVDDANDQSRIITFRTLDGGDYAVVLTSLRARIWNENGAVVGQEGVTLINGNFDKGSLGWSTNRPAWWGLGAAFKNGVCYLSVDGTYIQQTVMPSSTGYFKLRFEAQVYAEKLRVMMGSVPGAWDLALIEVEVNGAGGAYTVDFSVDDLTAKYLTVQVVKLPVSTQDPSAAVDNFSFNQLSGATPLDFVTPWAGEDLAQVQYTLDANKDRVYFVHEKYEPRILERQPDGAWTFTPPVWTAKPTNWAGSNWPACVDLYQGRLWMGGSPDKRSTFNASSSSDALNFQVGTNPGDAISFIVSTRSPLRWFRGARVMMMGTADTEIAVSAQGGLIYAGDFSIREESSYGSAPVQPRVLGDEVLYLSADYRKVRAILFNLQSEGWESSDLTLLADHMTVGGVKELHVARDPQPLVVLVMRSGELRVCTYDRQMKIQAWWRWTTPGFIFTAAVSHGASGSVLWALVDRGGGPRLERAVLGETSTTRFLDGYTETTTQALPGGLGHGPRYRIPGLGRFDGKVVQVVLGGVHAGEYLVVNGTINLSTIYPGTAAVGLNYNAVAKTLPPEGGNPHGTSMGMVKRRVDIGLRVSNSAMPKVNGFRPPCPVTSPVGEAPAPYSGEVVVRNLGQSTGAEVVIEQDLPLRTEVCAIFSQLDQHKV